MHGSSANNFGQDPIRRIWVCATPNMNDMFDKWLHNEKNQFDVEIM
jgi:hypothetical protein